MKRLRYKGKYISEKQLNKKLKQQSVGKSNKKEVRESKNTSTCVIEGCRIIDFKFLIEQMFCNFCKKELLVHNIEEEARRGLASILSVRCAECLLVKEIYTANIVQITAKGEKMYDVNLKAVLGTLHTGNGHTTVNKLMNIMEIPFMSPNTFKCHENAVGFAAEKVAKRSCLEVAKRERQLVMENETNLKKLLPEHLRSNFFVTPIQKKEEIECENIATKEINVSSDVSSNLNYNKNTVLDHSESNIRRYPELEVEDSLQHQNLSDNIFYNSTTSTENCHLSRSTTPQKEVPNISGILKPNIATDKSGSSTTSNTLQDTSSVDKTNQNEIEDYIVRVPAAFDMGYSKRGNGRQYDSLNGYLAMIGTLSGGIIDYTTRNRKCRRCDLNQPKESHDCRLNFFGSAKGMEADSACKIATNSSILKEINAELGIFIGDNDSASIHAIKNASNHPIVKHADKNHTSKGVKNMLYKISGKIDSDKELNNESIAYLHRCFCYALAQYQGDLAGLQAALRNIPYHAFNVHDNCREWCGYVKDPQSYEHRSVPGGFKNQLLFEELKKLFNSLAESAENFFAGASSQANESLNSVMARKCPKAICYSLSASADYRFACSVAQKNLGESYTALILDELKSNVGIYIKNHINRVEKKYKRKSAVAKTIKFKSRRRVLQKYRNQLKNRKEQIEGIMYESNMCFLNSTENKNSTRTSHEVLKNPYQNENQVVVFYDLETNGLSMNCDILQIAMKADEFSCNEYVYPRQSIPPKVTEVNGLNNIDGQLFLHGKLVPSSPLRTALLKVLEFLTKLGKRCILVAHNGHAFDAPRLTRVIQENDLLVAFAEVIFCFVDTLPLFKQILPERKQKKNGYKLTCLAFDLLNLPTDKAHDAAYDIYLMEQLVYKYVNFETLVQTNETLQDIMDAKENTRKSKEIFESLRPLEKVISKNMRNRLSDAGITYQLLIDTYTAGEKDLIMLLKKKYKEKKHLISKKKILDAIVEHCKK